MSPLLALILSNFQPIVTSVSMSFESARIEMPPPTYNNSLALIDSDEPLVNVAVASLSPPKSNPALNTGLISAACDTKGTAATSMNTSPGTAFNIALPVIFFSPLSWAAGPEQSYGHAIAYRFDRIRQHAGFALQGAGSGNTPYAILHRWGIRHSSARSPQPSSPARPPSPRPRWGR